MLLVHALHLAISEPLKIEHFETKKEEPPNRLLNANYYGVHIEGGQEIEAAAAK